MYHMYFIHPKWLVGRVLCPMNILHTWSILVGCLTKAKLWLISKTISKGRANNSLQYGLASKQFHKATITKHTYNIAIEMHLLRKHKLMASLSKVMEILLPFYSCEKTKQKNKCANTELLEGIQFVDANKTPNSHSAPP